MTLAETEFKMFSQADFARSDKKDVYFIDFVHDSWDMLEVFLFAEYACLFEEDYERRRSATTE